MAEILTYLFNLSFKTGMAQIY